LDEAEGDLEHAQNDLKAGFYKGACFLAQQSAEKSVKAVFQRMGAEAWGHSVANLLKELAKKHDVPAELVDVALKLNKSYIPTRYPHAHPSGSPRSRYTKREARRLIEYAERIFRFCSDFLSKDYRTFKGGNS